MSAPTPGDILYLGPDKTDPVVVVRVEGTLVRAVPKNTKIYGTHQGNLYDEFGRHPHRI